MIYNQMAKEMIAELDNLEVVTAATEMVKVGKLQQICGGFLTRTDVMTDDSGTPVEKKVMIPIGSEKLDSFMDLLFQYMRHHKVLVGCRFLWEIAQIEARLSKGGIGYVVVKGGMDGDARTEARHRFQSDKNCRVIVFQVSAATAMTLTAGDIGILYSCTTRWDDYRQWLKRIHRDGQTKPVLIQALAVRGTVDYHILEMIKAKAEMEGNIVDRSEYRKWLTPKF
jgi:SNF2 family DNA or RNA helicase